MLIEKEIDLAEGKDHLMFNSLEEFESWSNKVVLEHKDKKGVNLYISGESYMKYGESFDKVSISLSYVEEETEDERKKRESLEKHDEDLKLVGLFMEKHNIKNSMGTVKFLEYLKEGILKYSIEDFESFKKELL